MPKALVLLSGGLDSMLAAKLLTDQGVAVTGLTFTTPFFGAKKAEKASKQLGIPLKVIDISKEHFEIVKKPQYGYGKNVNPCIDCHGLMFKKAKDLVKKEGFDFVATGEVLGQRPMSQNKQALKIVEKLSGLEGKILRPMSAKLLDETEIEKKELVNRDRLLSIKGKSRKEQIALAKKLGFKKYATPGGGCLLTDPGYALRFKKLREAFPYFDLKEAELIKYGRLFVEKDYLFLVGRKHEENLELKKVADKNDILLEVKEVPGPITLLHFFRVTKQPIPAVTKKTALKKAAERTVRYANQKVRDLDKVKVVDLEGEEEIAIK
ncbi:DUF814 domain-containing protein, partial [Patescibacteria group bacterium]